MTVPLLDRLADDQHIRISDLQFDNRAVWRVVYGMLQIPNNEHDVGEWNAALAYLFGIKCGFGTVPEAKQFVSRYVQLLEKGVERGYVPKPSPILAPMNRRE